MVLGESTVAGIGAPTHADALSGRIAHAIAARTGRGVDWRAVGRSGATARDALDTLVPRLDGTADLLVVALGVNDVLWLRTPAQWTADLRELLVAARVRLGDPAVLIAGMPPVGEFRVFPQPLRLVLGLRARALDEATRLLAATLPHTVSMHLETGFDPAWFCDDRLHPSPHGYARWADQLAAATDPLLAH
ncbi:MAG TPA: SGNH/GDSL hydrolase family protein [Candidatus Binatia bacterium]|nr:SGNH/GDSL hydrolase family protein [Candidatus Binatia bacterium]